MKSNLPKFTSALLIVSTVSGVIFFTTPPKKAEAIIGIDTAISSRLCTLYAATIGSLLDDAESEGKQKGIDYLKNKASDLTSGLLGGTDVPVKDADLIAETKKITETNKQIDCEAFVKKVALGTLKKNLLDIMVDQLIQWIQYGDGHKPRFITDFGGFLDDAANVAVGDLVQEVGLGAICQPLKLSLQFALLPQKTFSQRSSCTLNKIVSNFDNFYNDIAGFNFVAYNEALKPQNNYYGAMLLASDEKAQRLASTLNNAQNEIVTGGGYLSQKRCLEWSFKDSKGKVVATQGSTANNEAPPVPSGVSGSWRCTESEVVTPGQTVGNLVSKGLGTDFEFIINADDLSAYVAAIGDAFLNRLINDAAKGLAGMRKPVVNETDLGPTGCEGLTGQFLASCMSSSENYNSSTLNQYVDGAKTNFQKSLANTSSSISSAYDTAKGTITKNTSLIDLITNQDPIRGVLQCNETAKIRLSSGSPITVGIIDSNLKVASSDLAGARQDETELPKQYLPPFTNPTGFFNQISYIRSESLKPANDNIKAYTKLSNDLNALNNDLLSTILSNLGLTKSRIDSTFDRETGFLTTCKGL